MASGTSPTRRPGARWLDSVRVRITLAAVLVIGLTISAAGWTLLHIMRDTQIAEAREEINTDLNHVIANLEDGAAPQQAIDAAAADFRGSRPLLQVQDPEGHVIASSSVGGRTAHGPSGAETATSGGEPQPDEATDEGPLTDEPPLDALEPAELETGTGGGVTEYETVTRTVETDGYGALTVAAAIPVEQVARAISALRTGLWLGLPTLAALVGAVAWVVTGRALRPVEAIRAEADEITGATIHRRVPEPSGDDEVAKLARTMNAMLSRLDRAATQQRQFVADASHELRSPVAAIRTRLEVARRNPERADWPAVADIALAEEARLERLLDDLLLLAAQDEHGTVSERYRPVDLRELVDVEAERERHVPVTLAILRDQPYEVSGDTDQLRRVVGNLVDNAARHATSNVRVGLGLHTNGSDCARVRLTVDDDGSGIPEPQRERVFERFTRLDEGRARAQGGAGLGLALVRSIVEAHCGRVWAEASPLGGARFVVDLPPGTNPNIPPEG